jgi:LytB protein
VERAVQIVERALEVHGPPVYVRKQIVHNTHVVADLEQRGAVFVGELDQVPAGALVVFSAHGVSPAVRDEADRRTLAVLDATQTTLAVEETSATIAALTARFPAVTGPGSDDICYATTNRQNAVAAVARQADLVLVVGSASSSNSLRLVEVARDHGVPAHLIDDAAGIQAEWLAGVTTVGLSAGASAPHQPEPHRTEYRGHDPSRRQPDRAAFRPAASRQARLPPGHRGRRRYRSTGRRRGTNQRAIDVHHPHRRRQRHLAADRRTDRRRMPDRPRRRPLPG